MLKRLAAILAFVWVSGCAYSVHQVHVSDFDTPYKNVKAGKIVRANAEQFVILNFAGNTDFVDEAYQRLQKQCPGGRISGITTQYSTALGFFSWTNKILMQGLCIKS